MNTQMLIVGGTFDHDGGRPSGLARSIDKSIREKTAFDITTVNGGWVEDLHEEILPSVLGFDVVLWFANVSNDEVKLRDVKSINPKCILITSKRNDDGKYTFAELISRALAIKANLTIEFSKDPDGLFNMMLFDPLGNVFYDGFMVDELCTKLLDRTKQLLMFTRVPSVQDTTQEVPVVPEETEFFSFAHSCADIFHNLIRPAKGTERFLGNMSFRCQNGFPSFRGENGIIYVSRRNVDKSDIGATSFVPTYLDDTNTVRYFGDSKPSVDTPIQLRLYKYFSWANYMIHAHCYVDTAGIPETVTLCTTKPIPCGAIEEVAEVITAYRIGRFYWEYNKHPRLVAINLVGHGCILIAEDVEILKELQSHKDSCFVARPMPELVNPLPMPEDVVVNKNIEPDDLGKLTQDLLEVAIELDARERSCNVVHLEWTGTSWKELCDMGIEILRKLRS